MVIPPPPSETPLDLRLSALLETAGVRAPSGSDRSDSESESARQEAVTRQDKRRARVTREKGRTREREPAEDQLDQGDT